MGAITSNRSSALRIYKEVVYVGFPGGLQCCTVMKLFKLCTTLCVAFQAAFHVLGTALPDLYEASVTELQEGLQSGLFTSVDLVKVIYHFKCLKTASIHITL